MPPHAFLNGAPKMGNHALWKACELLGIVTSGVNHVEHPADIERPRIFIRRDPRGFGHWGWDFPTGSADMQAFLSSH